MRFGEWEPVQDNLLPATAFTSTATPFAVPDKFMPEVEEDQLKKSIKRKKHPRVVNVLKQSVGATTITKRIRDLGINLTVGELLASALGVEKRLTKRLGPSILLCSGLRFPGITLTLVLPRDRRLPWCFPEIAGCLGSCFRQICIRLGCNLIVETLALDLTNRAIRQENIHRPILLPAIHPQLLLSTQPLHRPLTPGISTQSWER